VRDNDLHVLDRPDTVVAAGRLDEEVVLRSLLRRVSTTRQIAAGTANFERRGRVATQGRSLGGRAARGPAKPELVHGLPRRTRSAGSKIGVDVFEIREIPARLSDPGRLGCTLGRLVADSIEVRRR
jgi:hypothetical protein